MLQNLFEKTQLLALVLRISRVGTGRFSFLPMKLVRCGSSYSPLLVILNTPFLFQGLGYSEMMLNQISPDVLCYHFVRGYFGLYNETSNVTLLEGATYPNSTIGRTALNDTSVVTLEGNKSQVLAWTDDGGTTVMLNQLYVLMLNPNMLELTASKVLETAGFLSQIRQCAAISS